MKYLIITGLITLSSIAQAQDLSKEFGAITQPLKGKIYMQYKKLLKSNPNKGGKVQFEITISESGSVSGCAVKKSELSAPSFERSICSLYKSISYSSMSVKPARFLYEQQFLSM